MLENRSFDHVGGWLYENGAPAQFIGSGEHKFNGTSTNYYKDEDKRQKVYVSKYENGEISNKICLTTPICGGNHDIQI